MIDRWLGVLGVGVLGVGVLGPSKLKSPREARTHRSLPGSPACAHGRNKEAKRGGIIAIISYKSLGLSRTQNATSNPLPCPCFFNHQCNGSNLILAHHPAPPLGIWSCLSMPWLLHNDNSSNKNKKQTISQCNRFVSTCKFPPQ